MDWKEFQTQWDLQLASNCRQVGTLALASITQEKLGRTPSLAPLLNPTTLLSTSPSHDGIPLLVSVSIQLPPPAVTETEGQEDSNLTPSKSSSVFTSRQIDTKGFSSLLSKQHTPDLFTSLHWPYLQNPLVLITIISSYLSFVSGPAELCKTNSFCSCPPGT